VPLETAVWIIYLIPIVFSYLAWWQQIPLAVAIASTLLVIGQPQGTVAVRYGCDTGSAAQLSVAWLAGNVQTKKTPSVNRKHSVARIANQNGRSAALRERRARRSRQRLRAKESPVSPNYSKCPGWSGSQTEESRSCWAARTNALQKGRERVPIWRWRKTGSSHREDSFQIKLTPGTKVPRCWSRRARSSARHGRGNTLPSGCHGPICPSARASASSRNTTSAVLATSGGIDPALALSTLFAAA
jgi:hypothetical protein